MTTTDTNEQPQSQRPITPDSPLCQTLSCLPEKFIVDFANGIDVARDHIRVQRSRSSFFDRLYDGFTGQGARRQAEVNASLADGVEASLRWLGELSESVARSNWAIAQVNDRVTALTHNVAELAHYSADTRAQLQALANHLGQRLHGMEQEVARIDFIQKAQLHLEAAFGKWAAGRFAQLAPAARCYATLEELHWGPMGDYMRRYGHLREHERQCSEFIQIMTSRATQQLAQDAGIGVRDVADTRTVWLQAPSGHTGRAAHNSPGSTDLQQALAYMANGLPVEATPFVQSTISQRTTDVAVPLLANAQRMAGELVWEVFQKQ